MKYINRYINYSYIWNSSRENVVFYWGSIENCIVGYTHLFFQDRNCFEIN